REGAAMLRYAFVIAWILASLTTFAIAQEPSPALTRAQQSRQRDLLLRYGSRLMAVEEKYAVVRRMLDVFTPEQIEALDKLRISPSQAEKLLRVLQDNWPEGGLNEEGFKDLKKKVTTKFEDIMGSEQFDILLELSPSPQQWERLRNVLAQAASTPEGKLAWEASGELAASLTPDQKRTLDPFLNLAQPPKDPVQPLEEPPTTAPGKGPDPRRHFLFLRRTGLGDFYADITPGSDYSLHLPRTYRVEGGDPAILTAVSNESGIPTRLLGNWEGDVFRLARTSLVGPPPVMAMSGVYQISRGRLPARAVSVSPPVVELDAGRGQKITASLEFLTSREQKEFEQVAGGEFLVRGTLLVGSDKNTLVDLDFAPWQRPQAPVEASCLVQLTEEFFRHAASEYRLGHPDKFNFQGSGGQAGAPLSQVSFQVTDVGVTLGGCQPGQLRLFGRASLAHTGLSVMEAEFEVVTSAEFVQQKLQLKPVPGTLELRVVHPVYAVAPPSWIKTLEQIMGSEYAQGTSFALPEKYKDTVVKSGLLEASQLDQLKLFTLPTDDRRTSLVTVAAPSPPAPVANSAGQAAATPVDALQPRVESPAEFAVAFSDQAVTAALRRKVPEMLPIRKEVPADLQDQAGVKLTEFEVTELDLTYEQGLFRINNCVVNVYWSWGLFSGMEPGIRFKGTASLSGAGNPLKLSAHLQVADLEFLSPVILEQPPEEQQKNKEKLLKVLNERAMELPDPGHVEVPGLSERARLLPTAVKTTAAPPELLMQGRLEP
ncbi:MAG: hypothetical protein AB1758_30620, partial [Candidatus Eremiobacterota bacterium]